MKKPIILLAFANAFENGRILAELSEEQNQLRENLRDHFQVEELASATLKRIQNEFIRNGQGIRIFHFGGHANGEKLDLIAGPGEEKGIYAKGLASYLGKQKGVHLVFINGCHSEGQAEFYHKAGIPVVIGSTQALPDDIALDFAVNFYNTFAQHVDGKTIREAFDEAYALLLAKWPDYEGSMKKRDMVWKDIHSGTAPLYRLLLKNDEAGNFRHADFIPQDNGVKKLQRSPEKSYLNCDRYDQNEHFGDALKEHIQVRARLPLACVVHGDTADLPVQMCDRFYEFSVLETFRSQDLVFQPSSFRRHEISMPRAQDFKKGRKAQIKLKESFKKELELINIDPRDIEKLDGQQVIDGLDSHLKIVIFQHTLYAEYWDEIESPKFLRKYLDEFWKVDIPPGKPDILLIFCVQYSPVKGLGKLFGGKSGGKVEKQLAGLEAILLNRLGPVGRVDVQEWFDSYAGDKIDRIDNIFQKKKELPMDAILPQLKKIVEQ